MHGFGPTRQAAFEQGGLALMHSDRIEPPAMVEIACAAPGEPLPRCVLPLVAPLR